MVQKTNYKQRAFVIILILIKVGMGTQLCGQGCLKCASDDPLNSCFACQQGFLLVNNTCQYSECQPNLFFQMNDITEEKPIGNCLSICQPLSDIDLNSNTCQEQVECSSSYSTQSNIQSTGTPLDFFVYLGKYYVSLQVGYLSLYDKNGLYLIKNLNYLQGDLRTLNLNDLILVLSQDQQVFIWDIINESRQIVFNNQKKIWNNLSIQIISYLNQYIAMYGLLLDNTMNIQIIYNLNQIQQQTSHLIQISLTTQEVLFLDSYYFIQIEKQINIFQINYQSEQNVLNQKYLFNLKLQESDKIQQVVKSNQSNIYFVILNNSIIQLDMISQSSQEIFKFSKIQKVKLIQLEKNLNQTHLIILSENALYEYNLISNQANLIITEKSDQIQDFEVGNFSGMNNQLVVLKNYQQLNLFNFDDNSKVKFSLIQAISLDTSQNALKKLSLDRVNNNQQQSYLSFQIAFFTPTQIQIIQKSVMMDKQQLQMKIIKNFQLPFPAPNSQVISMIQVYSPSILISCHQNGEINFYDSSKGISIDFITKKNYNNKPCFSLERFSNNKIIAWMSSSIYLIDPVSQITLSELNNLINIVQIHANYDMLAINYNNCIQIFSSDLKSQFSQCMNDFSSNNNKIALSDNLKLIVQKPQQVSIYQIDISNQQSVLLSNVSLDNTINYSNFIIKYNSNQDIIQNNFYVDEIVIFDSERNFYIYSSSLSLVQQIKDIQLQSIIVANRVLNDDSAYFIAGQTIQKGFYSTYLISKQFDKPFIIGTNIFYPIMEEPLKVTNGYGNSFYQVNRVMNLNGVTLIKEYEIDIQRNITYVSRHQFIYEESLFVLMKSMVGSIFNYHNYIGTSSGLVYSSKFQYNRYEKISTQNILKSNKDQIQEIIQSEQIGMYFVRTNEQISSFQTFNNKFIELLTPQLPTDKPFTQFQLTQGNQSIICWNTQQLLLVVYNNIQSVKFYYQGMDQINGWVYDSTYKKFYIYGSSFLQFDSQLNLLQTIYSQQLNVFFIKCLDDQKIIVCSVNKNLFMIIQKWSNQIQKQMVDVSGFKNQFQICLDNLYSSIYLYGDLIQIYNYNGSFNSTYSLNANFKVCKMYSSQILFQSNEYIYFIYRSTLQPNENYLGPQVSTILDFIYIEYLQQVALYCMNNFFAQINFYDVKTMKNVQNVNNPFPQNQSGLVLKMEFDYNVGMLVFLDSQGNFFLFDVNQQIVFKKNFKITEVFDANEQLISYSFNNNTNDIFVYGTKQIYYLDYSLVSKEYEASLHQPTNLFAVIPINNQNIEFLFFDQDNTIFRYSVLQDNNINFVNTLPGSQIKDLTYDIPNDTLIIAQTDSLLFYNQYLSTQSQLSISNAVKIQQISFHKFLLPNLYLTYEKSIIHCDIQTAKIIKIIQLQQLVIITSHKSNKNKDQMFIGLSNGQVLQYNLNDQTNFYYSISNQTQVNTSIITIILSNDDQIGFFVTNSGIILKIDIQKQSILEEVNLISLVNEDPQILLGGFNYDSLYQRYIFFFNGQKWSYVWNISTNKLEKYLSLPISQTNQIKITQHFIIISCMFQINIYSLEYNIQLLTVIKKNTQKDEITDFVLTDNNIIIIFFVLKVEVFLIQPNNSVMIFQKLFNYPRFLGYIFNQSDHFLKVYGLHQGGVFENYFSVSTQQNDSISQCSISIQGSDIFEVKQKMNDIYPKQTLIDTSNGQSTKNLESWTNLIYLQISDNQFSNINQFISQNQFLNFQFIFYTDTNADAQQRVLRISNNTFQQYEKPSFQMFNYDFQFQNSTDQTIATFNKNIQQIKLQNISISNQCIDTAQIQITNVSQVTINFMKIWNVQECNHTFENQQQNFFTFENISQIYIYNLNISSNLMSQNQKINLFAFKSIDKIIFDKMSILNNSNLSSIFSFIKVNTINISNVTIAENKNKYDDQQDNGQAQSSQLTQTEFQNSTSIFNFFGCQSVSLSKINFTVNYNIQLIKSYNQYIMNDILTLLFSDIIRILDSQITSNQMPNSYLIFTQNQKVINKNLSYKNNKGSFTITKSQYVYIYQSTYDSNISQNGGAIYFQNIQGQLELTQTQFQRNEALSSGGALYFENLENCQISFDQQTMISQNKALIGGGLRIIQTNGNYIKLPPNYPFYQNVKNNVAEIYGDDSTTYLQEILIENDKLQDQNKYQLSFIQNATYSSSINLPFKYKSTASVNNFQSGGQLNLKIFIIDNYKRNLSFSLEKLLNSKYPNDIEQELKNIQVSINNFDTSKTQLIGEKILNFNQYNSKNFAFQLTGLQIQGVLQTEQYFQIDSSIFELTQQQFSILLIINFRNCEIGEIIQQQTSLINSCRYCSFGSYQLVDPNLLFSEQQENKSGYKNECNICPLSAIECEGKTIKLKNGYWRKNNFTDEIISCNSHVGSCQSENPQSINYCSTGYIGPLCQQCDVLGEVWNDNSYSEGFTQGMCEQCLEIQIQWVYFILKLFGTILYFLYAIFVFIRQFKYSQSCYYLRAMKLLPISKNSILDQSGFFIKIIINYYQLSSLLIPQNTVLSVNFNFLNNIFGQTNRQLSLGMDCIVSKDLIRQFGKVQFYSIIQFLMPFILLLITTLIIFALQFILKKLIKGYCYSTFFHIFLAFFQISQISYFTKSLTCIQVGNQELNPYDLEKECKDKDIAMYVIPSSIMILLFWSFLPFIFLFKLKKNKNFLNSCRIKYNYGYYYSELKAEFYYWEFIRINLKIVLIYISTLLQYKYQIFSATTSSVIIAIYILMLKKCNPFISQQLLSSETLAYLLISLKIYLSLIQIDIQSIQFISELMIALIDFFFFIYCGTIVIIYKASKSDSLMNKILRMIFQVCLPKNIYGKLFKKRISFKTYLLWKFVHKNISNIIEQKAQQNINLLTSKIHQSQFISPKEQIQSHKTLIQKQNQFILKDSLSSSYQSTQRTSNFRLLKLKDYQDQSDQDNIIESQYSQATEEKDPKKVSSYQFTPNLSRRIFLVQESEVKQTNESN